jgi:hypothetical protein
VLAAHRHSAGCVDVRSSPRSFQSLAQQQPCRVTNCCQMPSGWANFRVKAENPRTSLPGRLQQPALGPSMTQNPCGWWPGLASPGGPCTHVHSKTSASLVRDGCSPAFQRIGASPPQLVACGDKSHSFARRVGGDLIKDAGLGVVFPKL